MGELKSKVGKAGCHIENVGELLQEFDADFITESGNVINLTAEQYFDLLQLLMNKFKETMLECEGKEVKIDFGDGPVANILEGILKTLGFDL